MCAALVTASAGLTGLAAPSALAAGLPPQGVYEECAPSSQQQCAGELAQIGGAGFQLVLNYTAWYGHASDIQTYAGEAQADHVKVIWPLDYSAWRDAGSAGTLPSTYKDLAADCNCSTNSAFVQYVIGLVRSNPSTWGYYIGDELDPSQASAVAALAAEVRNLDPAHPLLYVAMGSADLNSTLQPFESTTTYAGADIYPIGGGGSASSVGPVASTVQQLARSNARQSAMVLQAFSWDEYPGTMPGPASWPTESDMQAMRDQALAADPSMILWYSIYDVLRSDNPAGHWSDLVHAAFAPAPTLQAATGGPGNVSSSGGGTRARLASLAHRRHRHRRHRHRRHQRHHHNHRHRHRRRHHAHPLPDTGPLFNSLPKLLLF